MLVFTCSREALIEIGSHIKVRVASINEQSVDLEIDTPGYIFLEPGESSYEQSQSDSSLEYLEITRSWRELYSPASSADLLSKLPRSRVTFGDFSSPAN